MLTVSNKQLLFVRVRIQQLVKCWQKNIHSPSISSILSIISNLTPVSKETSMTQQLQLPVHNCVRARICYFLTTPKPPSATHRAESSAYAAAMAVLMALQKPAQQHKPNGSVFTRQVHPCRALQVRAELSLLGYPLMVRTLRYTQEV